MSAAYRDSVSSLTFAFVMAVTLGACSADDELPPDAAYVAFVPGDAFFPVWLDPDTVGFYTGLDILDTEEPEIELQYDLPDVRAVDSFPQYRGFARLRLTGLTESDREILKELAFYTSVEGRKIAGNSGKEPDDAEIVHRLIVVNRDFQFERHRFFLRYNEHWMLSADDAVAKLPESQKAVFRNLTRLQKLHVAPGLYQPHIYTAEAVIEDWEKAQDVPAFRVTFPDASEHERPTALPVVIPLEVAFSEVAVVGFPTGKPKEIFQHRMNSTFYVATTKGVSRYRWILDHVNLDADLREEVVYVPKAD